MYIPDMRLPGMGRPRRRGTRAGTLLASTRFPGLQRPRLAAALLSAGVCLCVAGSARAQIAWAPCKDSNDFACGHLSVPLDPSGASSETITLAMRRHRAPVGDERDAVIALAGGPGPAAIPFAEQFAHMLGPIVSTRDLIVLDQRGIGLSHPLSCHRFEVQPGEEARGRAVAECAAQLGPTRTFYTTAQSVADIEAIRRAGGYEKLVLYGTSYGTKVAERYAQAHPDRVEALVLDSVVPPNGPDPLNRATFAAVPRILHQLCAHGSCARITRDPVADLARLVRRASRTRLRGRWIDGDGRGHALAISANDLLGTLVEGDLDPTLRAEFPAAARAAARGDTAALARLLHRAESGEGHVRENPSESFDTPLYFATTCEEETFPWSRAASPGQRLAEARAQIAALPARSIAPFAPANVLALSDVSACASWPFTTPAPAPADAPLPPVPTLILSGTDDLRTPTANAREIAAQIPGSHLLVVPSTGHSVLGGDPSDCSHEALEALFAGRAIKPCTGAVTAAAVPFLRLAPLPPARLQDVRAAGGDRGRAGRTLGAVVLTVGDFSRQLALQALAQLASLGGGGGAAGRVGGLRAGWADATLTGVRFGGYSYVPGVTITGRITSGAVELRVGGAAAARGTLRLGAHQTLIGVLGGKRVRLTGSGGSGAAGTSALVARTRRLGTRLRRLAAARPPHARTEVERLRAALGG
jgi:pimeloyl-ACP methyl ester carboxylesterase